MAKGGEYIGYHKDYAHNQESYEIFYIVGAYFKGFFGHLEAYKNINRYWEKDLHWEAYFC